MAQQSLPRQLFRRDAVDAQSRRWLGEVQLVSPPGAAVAALSSLLAIGLLLLATLTVDVPERIPAAGVLLPAERLLSVRASRAGIVAGLSVQDGDTVQRGQALLSIDAGVGTASTESPAKARLASLQREQALQAATLTEQLQAMQAAAEALRERRLLLVQRLAASEQEIATRTAQVELESRRLQRVLELSQKGVIPAQQADEQSSLALQAKVSRHAALQRRLELREQLAVIDNELLQESAASEQARLDSERQQEALQRELLAIEEQESSRLLAPDDGQVAGLLVRNGDAVSTRQQLMSLFRPDSELQAWIYISADDAGRVASGQQIELQLHAFPYQLYGTVSARVTTVSTVPVPGEAIPTSLPLAGAVFEIRAELLTDRNWLRQLGPGTSFRADLVASRWPLHRWLLRARRGAA